MSYGRIAGAVDDDVPENEMNMFGGMMDLVELRNIS